jgi:hypothetical protein
MSKIAKNDIILMLKKGIILELKTVSLGFKGSK